MCTEKLVLQVDTDSLYQNIKLNDTSYQDSKDRLNPDMVVFLGSRGHEKALNIIDSHPPKTQTVRVVLMTEVGNSQS